MIDVKRVVGKNLRCSRMDDGELLRNASESFLSLEERLS